MAQEYFDINIYKLLQIFFKNIIIILITGILFAAAAFGYFHFMVAPEYTTSLKLYVYSVNSASQTNADLSEINYAQKVVNTYIQMLQTNSFNQKIIEEAKAKLSLSDVNKIIKFSILGNTEVFQATVTTIDEKMTVSIANAIAKVAPEVIESLQYGAILKIVDPPLPCKEVLPPKVTYSIVAFLLGMMLTFGICFMADTLDVRIKNSNELAERYNIPVLGHIPDYSKHIHEKEKC